MDATKIVMIAVSVLVLAVIVGAIVTVMKQGQNAFKSGESTLTDQLSDLNTSKYDVYDGLPMDGSSVVDLINNTFDDPEIECVVCTKDGSNLVYNCTLVPDENGNVSGYVISNGVDGTAGTDDDEKLSNVPTYDALHKAFAEAGGDANPLTPATDLMVVTGYDVTTSVSKPGYISTTANFDVTVQKNVNGTVRRITFVQQ